MESVKQRFETKRRFADFHMPADFRLPADLNIPHRKEKAWGNEKDCGFAKTESFFIISTFRMKACFFRLYRSIQQNHVDISIYYISNFMK